MGKSTQSKDNAKSQAKSLKPFNKKMGAQIQSKDLSLFFKNYYHEKFETPEQIPSMMCRQTNDLKQFLTLSKLKKEFDSKIQQFDNKMGFFAYKDSQLDKRMDGLQSSGVKYHNFMTKSIKKTELISKKTKENEIQEYNNEIARLQERLDKAKSNAADWEGKCAEVQKQTNNHNLLLGKLKAST